MATGTARRPATVASTTATYRMLRLRGLAHDEAVNLTAFLSGIHVGDEHWTLREVNRLLFLRELHRTGRLGDRMTGATDPG
jgi:hypothetical protein